MADYWAGQGRAVTVLTLAAQNDPPFYPLPPDVHRVGLGRSDLPARPSTPRSTTSSAYPACAARSGTASRDVVISFLDQTNVLTLLATRGLSLPVVVSEHTDPGLAQRHRVWDRLRALLYPRADRIVVLSESSKAFFPPGIRAKTRIIPNPVQVDCPAAPVHKSARPQVVAMGRFGPEKGFDRLIDAFSRIAADFPDWDLVIWGDGVLRPESTAQRDRLGLTTVSCSPAARRHHTWSSARHRSMPSPRTAKASQWPSPKPWPVGSRLSHSTCPAARATSSATAPTANLSQMVISRPLPRL